MIAFAEHVLRTVGNHVALALATGVATTVGTLIYRNGALKRGIIAQVNTRTLHEHIVPRGGGVVIAATFSIATLAVWAGGSLSTTMCLALVGGGVAAATVGFVDDVHELRATTKLGIHLLLSLGMLLVLYEPLYGDVLGKLEPLTRVVVIAAVVFVPLWLINLYNFIDGVDGMAASGAVFICAAATIILALTKTGSSLSVVFVLLGASSFGFLLLNLPPAKIFMGDAGSIFLGYSFAVLILTTVFSRQLSAWTWIALLSYFIADTTTTTVCRIALVKRWYGVHRSHAYQNLARILNSHAKVTYGVVAYHVFWAFPLAVWSSMSPRYAPIAAALAVAPGVAWTLRFGPRFSSA